MLQICKSCGETILAVFLLRHNTSDEPVEHCIKPQFCPVCGTMLGSVNNI